MRGSGVPSDYTLAYMWFNLAAAGGFRPAPEGRDSVAKLMDAGTDSASANAITRMEAKA
jgi:hypothetical protein